MQDDIKIISIYENGLGLQKDHAQAADWYSLDRISRHMSPEQVDQARRLISR